MKEDQIATMVEAQIQDQMTKIDDKKTQNEAYAVLLYGQDPEEKDVKPETNEELEKKAVQSLINEDKHIEDEEKQKFEARIAL